MKNRYLVVVVLVIVIFCAIWSYNYILGTQLQVQSQVFMPVEIDISDPNEPTIKLRWYVYPPEHYNHYLSRKNEVVAQWLQSRPSHRQHFVGVPSPHTFEEWIEKGRNIPYLEDTLIKFYKSGNKNLSNKLLLTALDNIGTNKSIYIIHEFLRSKEQPEYIRTNSALALGRKESQPSSIKLLRSIALDSTESPSLRALALMSLSELEGDKAIQIIEKVMEEQGFSRHLRGRLLKILEQMK